MVKISEMKGSWGVLKKWMRKASAPRARGGMDLDVLKTMAREIMATRPDEIGCDECFKQADHFADMVLDGKDAAAAMPLVQDHLNRCTDCREEYEALLAAMRPMS
jgi:hypothetical protein